MAIEIPRWLWRLANGLLAASVLGVAALAVALARGWADPPRAGPLWLYDDFKGEVSRWSFTASHHAALRAQDGALRADLGDSAETVALTAGPSTTNYSIEMAGTPVNDANDIAYGLVFAWRDAAHYSAVLVNGNGYAEAYRQDGDQRVQWHIWQQWPHAFAGANRVRVEVRGQQLTMRVNDELLAEAVMTETVGQLGVLARSAGPAGGVVFSWVKVWADAP